MSFMSMTIRRFCPSFSVLLCTFMLAGYAEAGVEVSDAWIAEAPPNVSAQAGYLTLKNGTAKPVSLTGVTSDAFKSVQIHHTQHDAAMGMMKMSHAKAVEIPAEGTLQFKPGGYHLMLMGPKSTLKAGDQIEMNLTFTDGTEFKATFTVRRNKFTL